MRPSRRTGRARGQARGEPRGRASARAVYNRAMLLHAATIFLSAFLLFLVQPLLAKQILPWFGGAAIVWTLCMVFFQFVLLLSLAFLPVAPDVSWTPLGGANLVTGIL